MGDFISLELIKADAPEAAAQMAKMLVDNKLPGLVGNSVFVEQPMPAPPGRDMPEAKFNLVARNDWDNQDDMFSGLEATTRKAVGSARPGHFASLRLIRCGSQGSPASACAVTSIMICKMTGGSSLGTEAFFLENIEAFSGFDGCVSSELFKSVSSDSPFDFTLISNWQSMAAMAAAMQGTSYRGEDPRSHQIEQYGALLREV